MSGLHEIKAALADYLREGYAELEEDEGNGWAVQVEPGYVIGPTPPTVDIYQGRTPARDLDAAGYGDEFGAYLLTVRFRMLSADYDAGTELMDLLSDDESDYSLAAGVEAAYPLDGMVSSIDVQEFSGLTVYPEGEVAKWLGFELAVRIIPAFS